MRRPPSAPVAGRRRPARWTAGRAWLLAAVATTAAAAFAAAFAAGPFRPPPAGALLAARHSAGRTTGAPVWRPCAVLDSAVVPRARCGDSIAVGTPAFEALEAATADAARRLARDSTAAGRHRRIMLGFRWHAALPGSLDRAVAQLEAARAARPHDVGLLNDLAAAYEALAERDQTLLPLLRALDALEHALAVDATFAPALFNRALVMERLYLVSAARDAWDHYARTAADDGWRAEARARAAAMARVLAADAPPADAPPAADTAASLAAAARRAPRHTRELGVRALGEWGRAELRGDAPGAAAALAVARWSLARDTAGADGGTGAALAALHAARGDAARRRALAAAYATLADGHRLLAGAAWDSALVPLARGRDALRALGSPLAGWAALYHGSSLLNLGHYAEADRALAAAAADSARVEPALASRLVLALGVSQVRRGNFERANDYYRLASPFLAAVRERETVGYAAFLRAEGFDRAGQTRASHDEALRALQLLAPLRRSNYLNNQLTEVAAVARGAGLHRAALAVMDEVVQVAAGVAKPETIALALARRARDQYGVGRPAAGIADLRAAASWTERMRQGRGHARIRAFVQLTTGELTRGADPRAALPLLDDAVRTFREFGTDLYLPAALHESALALEALGDRAAARARLEEAVRAVERMQGAFRGSGARAVFAERVERISDRAIDLALDDGDASRALDYLERAREAVMPVAPGRAPAAPPGADAIARALPPGTLLVEYALLPHRLVAWSVSRGGVRVHTARVRRDSVAALVARLGAELASDAAGDPRGASARLFELLLGPLRAELAEARSLVVVPDRELHQLPFVALRDTATGRFLVEAAEVRSAPSAAFLVASLGRRAAAPARGLALVVGDPALGAADVARLGRLPGAAGEADRVARLYPSARLLAGPAATRGDVVAGLDRAAVLHFAGHAVFNADRPELSYLALADDGVDGGRLRAREIGGLRLSNTRVVVLSACSTLNPRPTRAGAAAGLAYSFLSAGVPSTVSTLWDVRDAETADLLVGFHRALAAGADPAAALRRAQLDALRSSDPLLRAPRTWAAFTFTGF